MTMDIEPPIQAAEPPLNIHQDVEPDKELETIINFLAGFERACFKSQQRGENDLTKQEKLKIGMEIFNKNKLQFLIRFGDFLLQEHLEYFKKFTYGEDEESNDLGTLLSNLEKNAEANKKRCNVKNRRYEALLQMISEGSYFSEIEMMKRNPLLYEKLVGQYLTREERRERDKYNSEEQNSFVKILMEGIERDDAEIKRKTQEEIEDDAMEENDSDSDDDVMQNGDRSMSPTPNRTLWGEYENEEKRIKPKQKNLSITADERKMLKEEFITTMYQNFLDGSDEDFDYDTVDCNSKYDSVGIIEHDEEDKYFDSEEPADAPADDDKEQDSSEDELDIYMSALNDNPTVKQLSEEMKKVHTTD